MEDVNKLIEKLSWGTPDEIKEEAINKLQHINDEDLHLLLQPISKAHWEGAAEVVIKLGYPRVKSILPGLLKWLQDLNWPGAGEISTFLRDIGDPIIPNIKDVFNRHSDDEGWIDWIFELIIENWSKKQVFQIRDELIQMSKGRTNDLRSLRILLVHGIYRKEEIKKILQGKKEKAVLEVIELEKLNPGIDCLELERGFKKVIFKPELSRTYYEQNKAKFSFCNQKSNLYSYLSDIESFSSEVSNFA